MASTHNFRWTNANVRGSNGELLFPPYLVTEKAGLRVGVISVLGPDYKIVTMSAASDEFTVDSPRDALDKYLPELRGKADVIVLLAQLSGKDTRELLLGLGEGSGIDICVESHDPRQYRRINKVGDVHLVAANNQGKYVGQLDMLVSKAGIVEDATLTIHALDKQSPEIKELVDKVKKFEEENKAAGDTRTSFIHPRDKGDDNHRFLGAHSCGTCHKETFQNYLQSAHARAWDSLTTKGQTNNEDCVACHSVGFFHKNGYDRVADAKVAGREALTNVQCEACHGYGTGHDREGSWLAQAKDSCVTCHDQQNSPEFDYETYWAKIAH